MSDKGETIFNGQPNDKEGTGHPDGAVVWHGLLLISAGVSVGVIREKNDGESKFGLYVECGM